jgi:hypothetical protein
VYTVIHHYYVTKPTLTTLYHTIIYHTILYYTIPCSAWKAKARRLLSTPAAERVPVGKGKSAKKAGGGGSTDHASLTAVSGDKSGGTGTGTGTGFADTVLVNRTELTALYLEGSSLPINTRIVPFLTLMLDLPRDTEEAPPPKKKKRKGEKEAEEGPGGKGKVAPVLVPVRYADCPNSSDEEAEEGAGTGHGSRSARRGAGVAYRVVSDFQRSSLPDMWPVATLGPNPRPANLVASIVAAASAASASATAPPSSVVVPVAPATAPAAPVAIVAPVAVAAPVTPAPPSFIMMQPKEVLKQAAIADKLRAAAAAEAVAEAAVAEAAVAEAVVSGGADTNTADAATTPAVTIAPAASAPVPAAPTAQGGGGAAS